MKFTVDRRTWLRGEGNARSSLYRESDKKSCCLGFLGAACGYSLQADLNNQGLPVDLWDWSLSTRKYPTSLSYEAQILISRINDDSMTSDAVKETQLTQAFSDIGITVEFIN